MVSNSPESTDEPRCQAVLVEWCSVGGYDNPRSSGILLHKHWVLTHGSILSSSQLKKEIKNQAISELLEKFPDFIVRFKENDEIREIQATHLSTCRSFLLSRSVESILNEWSSADHDNWSALLPVFLVLQLNTASEKLLPRLPTVLNVPPIGSRVYIESTPFSTPLFMNSLSEGIVSNIMGPSSCLILTDASAAPGSEGAPIFYKDQLIGMVISCVSYWRGEWVGFTLGVALQPVLQQLVSNGMLPLSSTTNEPVTAKPARGLKDNLWNSEVKAIVLIKCGTDWGSGVLVAPNLIVTCSHVVQAAPQCSIHVNIGKESTIASLLYRTRDDYAYDIAVLHISKYLNGTKEIKIAKSEPTKGETVIAAGYSLFSEDFGPTLSCTLSSGIVAQTHSCMLQTTCCIQSGSSGGAIFRPNGELLAVIVCNTIDKSNGILFPFINMAVPVSVIEPSLSAYMETKDAKVLQQLESDRSDVQRMWRFQTLFSKL